MSGLVVMSPSPKPIAPNPRPVDPGVSIGHVHLKVADLNRAIAFYCGVLGFDLMQRMGMKLRSFRQAVITTTLL
jgi:catechol-2,3-dioxygenase